MTPFENLKKDCPGLNEDALYRIVRGMCPFDFGYEAPDYNREDGCPDAYTSCIACWNGEHVINPRVKYDD